MKLYSRKITVTIVLFVVCGLGIAQIPELSQRHEKVIANSSATGNITIAYSGSQYEITNDDDNSNLFTSHETYADEVIAKALEIIETDGQITIESGEYLTQYTVLLKSNITIRGVDTTAVIKRVNSGHVIVGNDVKYVTIKKLKVQSSMDYPSYGSGIFLRNGASNNIIDSCVVREVAGHGITINDITSENNVISNNIVADCDGNSGIGLMWKAGNATITKNKVYRTKTHGIIVSGGASNCTITHNYVESSGYYRPIDAPISEYFCHGIAIDGGLLENRGANHLIQGNTVINSGRAGIEVADGQDSVVIRDNYVQTTGLKSGDASDQYGIYFGGALRNGVNGKIINNRIYNAKKEGIKIGSGNASIGRTNDVLVDSNLVSNSMENGIRAECVGNAVITNNEVVNSVLNGVKLEGKSGFTAQNITISNNEISGSNRYGIDLSYAETVDVNDNIVCNNVLGVIYMGTGLSDVTSSNNQCTSAVSNLFTVGNEISVYPNPFLNILTVSGKKDITNLKIYQIDGSLVYSKEFDAQNTITLSTENYRSGIYILSIQTVDGYSRMIIIRS
jgi:parallel beta-helix repeat protein